MADKEGKADAQPYHLVLLAKNWTGYQNLCRLVTDAHIDGYYYKPRIDREHLAQHSEGLIGLSACLNGEVPRALEPRTGSSPASWPASTATSSGGRVLPRGPGPRPARATRLNEQLLRLAPEVGIPLVATNDLHYVRRDQSEAHDVLLCVGRATTSTRRSGCASSRPSST